MLSIGNKTFMNLQEAVGWLLENNALPFQSTANYVGNTEIAMSTLINPSPAKVRVGSLIFFADSKVSTVIGVTSNSFIVSDQYNDLVDDVVYVSNVEINASGHLIVTLSNGTDIDAGLIKQVSNFSIDASQHLIANYNDGTSTDLGAIFSGNITISGDLTVTGTVDGATVTGNLLIEKMSGYSANIDSKQSYIEVPYISVSKTGNKLTLVATINMNMPTGTTISNYTSLATIDFYIPSAIGAKVVPLVNSRIDSKNIMIFGNQYLDESTIHARLSKSSNTNLTLNIYGSADANTVLSRETDYSARYELTLLLSDSLI